MSRCPARVARRLVRPRADFGQGSLEYVGIAIVAALLVGALLATDVGTEVRTAVSCQVRKVVAQSGDCGGAGQPTTYDADGPTGSAGPGVGSTPPGSGEPPGREDAGDGGGGSAGAGWDNGDATSPEPADAEVVDEAVDTFQDKLDGGWNGVRSGELGDIYDLLDGLTGAELDAVIASMSDEELEHWVDELDDGSIVGSGWSFEERRRLWSMIAAKASADTMRRLDGFTDEVQPEFDDVGGDDARDDPESPANTAEYDEVPHELFADDPTDDDEPTIHPTDLNQGMIGDCWLIASIGAIANNNPGIIEDMIQENANGTYTVTFRDDGEAVEVTVSPDIPTDDGAPVFVQNPGSDTDDGSHELWPHLIEKAAAQYYGDYADLEGDWPSKALELLTGDDVDTYDTDWVGLDDPDPPSVGDIDEVLADGGAVLVSTDSENRTDLYDDGTLVTGHAYYVQQVDADAGTVTVVNPWGLDDYAPITMSYEDFEESFIRYDVADMDEE